MGLIMKELLYAFVGCISGYFVSYLSEAIIKYKFAKKNKKIPCYFGSREECIVCTIAISILFVLSGYYYSGLQSVLLCVFCLLAVIGAIIDIRTRIIPNELVLIIFVLGFLFNLLEGGWQVLGLSVVSCLITFAMFLFAARITYYLVKSIGVGAGDIKLASAIAFAVGFERLAVFYLGIVVGLLIYLLIGLRLRLIKIGSTFPMGVQIMAGFIAAFLLREVISSL